MKIDITSTPIKPLLALVANFTRGRDKRDDGNSKNYGQFGWRATPDAKRVYQAALFRHVMGYLDGEFYDSDGIPHLVGAGCNVLILLDLELHDAANHSERAVEPGPTDESHQPGEEDGVRFGVLGP